MAKETRPLRMCDVCGGVDDHPRHVFAHAAGDGATDPGVGVLALQQAGDDEAAKAAVMRHVKDDSTAMRHFDCCRDAGCPDGSCNAITKGAEDKRGDQLVKFLTGGTGADQAKTFSDELDARNEKLNAAANGGN